MTNERLKSIIHYICSKAGNPYNLGSVRLNKILRYSDSAHYVYSNQSITGAKYIKKPLGPVAENLVPCLLELEKENKIAINRGKDTSGQYPMWHYFSLEEPDVSAFSHSELSMVDGLTKEIVENHTATSISNISHDLQWEIREDGEEIPYHSIYCPRLGEVSSDDIEWAKSILRKKNYIR